jgi:hypothetical protein
VEHAHAKKSNLCLLWRRLSKQTVPLISQEVIFLAYLVGLREDKVARMDPVQASWACRFFLELTEEALQWISPKQ